MRRFVFMIVVSLVVAFAGTAFFWMRLEKTHQESEQSVRLLTARLDAAERQTLQLKKALTRPSLGEAQVAAVPPQRADTADSPADITLPEVPKTPAEPILSNAMRDILVEFQQCVLATRTLRCPFTVTNRSPSEKKFGLGVGGRSSRFEQPDGGSSVFDDVGNDFLSAGGGVANYAQHNCDIGYRCVVEKTLSPGVRTAGWLRFDAVDPNASVIKLLRMKWTDGEAWVAMDFRGIPLGAASR